MNEPVLTERDVALVTECVRSGWVSSAGRFINEFEERWAAYCGRRFGIAVSSGTAALQVAVAALKLQPGDEVILPTFTIISCALAVVQARAVPIFVDSEPRTWTMDVEQVARHLSPRTKAIMVVHIYGHPADMDPIVALAEKHGVAVIEDAAEAHGAQYLTGRAGGNSAWRRCGSFGDLSCFSFYANKLITTGEGGMVLTDDPRLAERARSFRNLCLDAGRRYYHEDLGFNFRLTNLQAALGLSQLERIDCIVDKKRRMGHDYTQALQSVPGLQLAPNEPWAQSVYWMYGIVAAEETGMNARECARGLRLRGIETRPFFLGMHEQPVFRGHGLSAGGFPVAERLARQGLYLPSGLALTPPQLRCVTDAVRDLFRQ